MKHNYLAILLTIFSILTMTGQAKEISDLENSGHFEEALALARKNHAKTLIPKLEHDVLYVGSSTELLFDEEGRPRPTLLNLMEKLGMKFNPEEEALNQIADWSQKNLLRRGERWDPQSHAYESIRNELMPLFDELGLLQEVSPSFKEYDTAVICGALLSRVRFRLSYLIEQWQKGVRFKELVFLGGERPLNPDLENEKELLSPSQSPLAIRKKWYPPEKLPKTEAEMEKFVWNQSEIPQEMKDQVKVVFINTPMQPIAKTPAFRRPSIDDTLEQWLKEGKPKPGKYLFVSNNPFTRRMDLVARNMLPKDFGIDTVGSKANPSLEVALYLDELARWIDQMKGYWDKRHAATALSPEQKEKISLQIWKNECAGTVEGLTSWNEGEQFASLGIGHFIWYPEGQIGPFVETFPDLLAFLKTQGVQIPRWIQLTSRCPWGSKKEFVENFQSKKMIELRQFLESTRQLQALFMAERLEASLPKMTEKLSVEEKKQTIQQYFRVAQEPMGMYVLLDYLNFKGEGTSENERYKHKGWGLLQVLLSMPYPSIQSNPIKDFITSAKQVLEERVANSPQDRNERKWIKGWYNRLDTYTE